MCSNTQLDQLDDLKRIQLLQMLTIVGFLDDRRGVNSSLTFTFVVPP